jgi:hypothetical protein
VTPEALRRWATDLRSDDQVESQATGNSGAIATLLAPVVIGATVASSFGAQRRHSTRTAPGRMRMKALGGSARSDVVAAKNPTEPTMTGHSDIR